MYQVADLPARVADKIVVQADGCWRWTGAIKRGSDRWRSWGYGRIRWDGRVQKAHRVVYAILVGPVPDELPELDHKCHVAGECPGGNECPHRACVNPAHLEPVTNAENRRRALLHDAHWQRKKDMCPAGHLYDEANTYWYRGWRYCRACKRVGGRHAGSRPEARPGTA